MSFEINTLVTGAGKLKGIKIISIDFVHMQEANNG